MTREKKTSEIYLDYIKLHLFKETSPHSEPLGASQEVDTWSNQIMINFTSGQIKQSAR